MAMSVKKPTFLIDDILSLNLGQKCLNYTKLSFISLNHHVIESDSSVINSQKNYPNSLQGKR